MERLDGKQLDGREIRVSKAMHGRPDGTAGPPRRRDRFAFVLHYYVDLCNCAGSGLLMSIDAP